MLLFSKLITLYFFNKSCPFEPGRLPYYNSPNYIIKIFLDSVERKNSHNVGRTDHPANSLAHSSTIFYKFAYDICTYIYNKIFISHNKSV